MKSISLTPRITLLALALGTASFTGAFAQTTQTPVPTTSTAPVVSEKHHHASVLTAAEKAQLEKAHDAVVAANPALKAEGDALKQQHQALKSQANVTQAEKDALKAQFKAHEEKVRAAMLAIDPTLGPIFAKLDAAHAAKTHNAGA